MKKLNSIYVKITSYDQLLKAKLVLDLYKVGDHPTLDIVEKELIYNFKDDYYMFLNINGNLGIIPKYHDPFNSFTEIPFNKLITEY